MIDKDSEGAVYSIEIEFEVKSMPQEHQRKKVVKKTARKQFSRNPNPAANDGLRAFNLVNDVRKKHGQKTYSEGFAHFVGTGINMSRLEKK